MTVFLLSSIIVDFMQEVMRQVFIEALLLPVIDNTASLARTLDYWQEHFIWLTVTTANDDLSIITTIISKKLRHVLHH
jgi:hypothetical protein